MRQNRDWGKLFSFQQIFFFLLFHHLSYSLTMWEHILLPQRELTSALVAMAQVQGRRHWVFSLEFPETELSSCTEQGLIFFSTFFFPSDHPLNSPPQNHCYSHGNLLISQLTKSTMWFFWPRKLKKLEQDLKKSVSSNHRGYTYLYRLFSFLSSTVNYHGIIMSSQNCFSKGWCCINHEN